MERDAGIAALRITVGLIFAAHGAQKAFGWWKGPGYAGWTPVAVSITRPSKHHPTFEYDQKLAPSTPAGTSAARRASGRLDQSGRRSRTRGPRSGSPERFARRSRRVARSAQPLGAQFWYVRDHRVI